MEEHGESLVVLFQLFFLFLISAGAQRGVSSLSLGKQGAVSWLTNKQ